MVNHLHPLSLLLMVHGAPSAPSNPRLTFPPLWPHGHAPVLTIVGMVVVTRCSRVLLPPSSRAPCSFHRDQQLGRLFFVHINPNQEQRPRHGRALAMAVMLRAPS
jgi:hypothetical protein